MNLSECSKSFACKEEFICKNECEVIIDVLEDGPDLYGNMNYSFYDKPTYVSSEIDMNAIQKVPVKKVAPNASMRFGCIVCDYKTANSTNFKIHLRTHTGEKPYKCELCPYRAKVLCALYRHKRVHTGERPYPCNECSYRAGQPSHLVRHKMIHTGERPYSCDQCTYSASQMSHLVRHMSVHTNYRPFPCSECPYRAKRKSHLEKHLGKHEKENLTNVSSPRKLRSANRDPKSYKEYTSEENAEQFSIGTCSFCGESTKIDKQDEIDEEQKNKSISDNVSAEKNESEQCDENLVEDESVGVCNLDE